MRRESYLSQPSAVEVYPVFSGTDVIMRKNIELVDKEDIQDGKKNKYKVWECEEVQFHYQGKVSRKRSNLILITGTQKRRRFRILPAWKI